MSSLTRSGRVGTSLLPVPSKTLESNVCELWTGIVGDQVPAVITRQTSINSAQTCGSASCSSEVLIAASRKMLLLPGCLHIAVDYIGTFKWERIRSGLYEGVIIAQCRYS